MGLQTLTDSQKARWKALERREIMVTKFAYPPAVDYLGFTLDMRSEFREGRLDWVLWQECQDIQTLHFGVLIYLGAV